VWCATSRNRIIGPILFDYTTNEGKIARGYLQRDCGAAHAARVSMTLLSKCSGWPPRSPDLTAPDYYL
jgi:hypothetical protein